MNITVLVGDLRSLAAMIVALKRTMRASGHNISSFEAMQLRDLKYRATKLCCLRAHVRGRRHLGSARMTFEEQAAFIDDERQVYTRRQAA